MQCNDQRKQIIRINRDLFTVYSLQSTVTRVIFKRYDFNIKKANEGKNKAKNEE